MTIAPFPHPVLTRVSGRPNYASLNLLRSELNANAMAIHSARGGGKLGHLALLMTDADYLALSGSPFDLPPHPGTTPTVIAPVNAASIKEATRVHLELRKEHEVVNYVTNGLRCQLLAAVEPRFVSELKDTSIGFANITLLQFLTHLFTNFGTITGADLNANRASILTAWNIDDPIQELWAKLKVIRDFAAAGKEPMDDDTLLQQTIILLQNTGVYDTDLAWWDHQPEAAQTWENFKTFFTKVDTARVSKLTKAQAGMGYHSANSVAPGPPSSGPPPAYGPPSCGPPPAYGHPPSGPPPAYGLPPAKRFSRGASDSHTSYYSTYPPSVAGTGVSSLPSSAGVSTANNRRDPNTNRTTGGGMHYCWSHGVTLTANHTSANCRTPKEGHRATATGCNTMGGCTTFTPRNGNGNGYRKRKRPAEPST
jgi:hypothetical protein